MATLNLPDGAVIASPEDTEKMQKRMEVICTGLIGFFKTNNIAKDEAAIAMTMVLNGLKDEGIEVIHQKVNLSQENN